MATTDYATMPFDELFHIVFADSGRVNACGRTACKELIIRLENAFGTVGEFGNRETGCLNLPIAYHTAKGLFLLKP